MAKKLAIPKKGDLVLCIKSGWAGLRGQVSYIQLDNMGVVVNTYASPETSIHYRIDTVTVKWLNCDTTKFYIGDKANRVTGWKKWIRVAQ
jgi:hypothetical protein